MLVRELHGVEYGSDGLVMLVSTLQSLLPMLHAGGVIGYVSVAQIKLDDQVFTLQSQFDCAPLTRGTPSQRVYVSFVNVLYKPALQRVCGR